MCRRVVRVFPKLSRQTVSESRCVHRCHTVSESIPRLLRTELPWPVGAALRTALCDSRAGPRLSALQGRTDTFVRVSDNAPKHPQFWVQSSDGSSGANAAAAFLQARRWTMDGGGDDRDTSHAAHTRSGASVQPQACTRQNPERLVRADKGVLLGGDADGRTEERGAGPDLSLDWTPNANSPATQIVDAPTEPVSTLGSSDGARTPQRSARKLRTINPPGQPCATQALRVLLAVCSAAFCGVVFYYLQQSQLQDLHSRFDAAVQVLPTTVGQVALKHINDVENLAAVFNSPSSEMSCDLMSLHAFDNFAQSSKDQMIGQAAIACNPFLRSDAEVAAFEASATAVYEEFYGLTNLNLSVTEFSSAGIVPYSGNRSLVVPVFYIGAPTTDVIDTGVLFLDIYSGTDRAALVDTMIEMNASAMGPRVRFGVQTEWSVNYFTPLYNETTREINGLLSTTLRTADLLRFIFDDAPTLPLDAYLIDNTDPNAPQYLHGLRADDDLRTLDDPGSNKLRMWLDLPTTGSWSYNFRLESDPVVLGGREWVLFVKARDEYTDNVHTLPAVGSAVILVLFCGIGLLWYNTLRLQNSQLQALIDARAEAHRRLTGYLCHELRNPLHGVSATLDALADDFPQITQSEMWASLQASRQTMQVVLDDILDGMRVKHTDMRLSQQVADVAVLAKETIAQYSFYSRVPMRLEVSDDDLMLAHFDRPRIRQVLTNGLSNSIKFTDEGEIVVRLTRMPHQHNIRVDVEDTGPGLRGINPELLFAEFESEADLSSRVKSTGLGLPIAKTIIERHRGSIGLYEDEPRHRTVFWFTLPEPPDMRSSQSAEGSETSAVDRNTEDQTIGQRRTLTPERGWPNFRFVAVDDEPVNRKLLQRMLLALGVDDTRLAVYPDGEPALRETLERLRDTSVQLETVVLTDILMNTMNGDELCCRLRGAGFNGILIALTGDASMDSAARFREEGFDHVLAKPYNKDALKQCIDSAIINRRV